MDKEFAKMLAVSAVLSAMLIARGANIAVAGGSTDAYDVESSSNTFSYDSDRTNPSLLGGFARWARNLVTLQEGPLMICDQDGYRCDPNPAYFARNQFNYQQHTYTFYQDGLSTQPQDSPTGASSTYSYDNVPLMGSF